MIHRGKVRAIASKEESMRLSICMHLADALRHGLHRSHMTPRLPELLRDEAFRQDLAHHIRGEPTPSNLRTMLAEARASLRAFERVVETLEAEERAWAAEFGGAP